MKTLINKTNPAIRITAPEIEVHEEEDMYFIPVSDYCIPMYIPDWTLVEEPKKKKNCSDCPHCVDRKDQNGWHFKGCFGGPYKGKFIAEIDECPLVEEEPEKINFFLIVHQSYEDKVKMYMTTTKKELAEMMARRDCIEDALQQQRTLDISQEPVTRMVGEQGALEIEKVNCPFDKGDCRYCTVQFCGAREENHIETRSTAEPVDLEKEYKEYVEDDPVFSKLTNRYAGLGIARHFYELGLKARKEE